MPTRVLRIATLLVLAAALTKLNSGGSLVLTVVLFAFGLALFLREFKGRERALPLGCLVAAVLVWSVAEIKGNLTSQEWRVTFWGFVILASTPLLLELTKLISLITRALSDIRNVRQELRSRAR